jgi:unsaturated chondroitin disaccharide hydrolase
MIKIRDRIQPSHLAPKIRKLWDLSAEKILALNKTHLPEKGSPVFTVQGLYTSRGWTEWTQGFQVGSAILQFDATGDNQFLDLGRNQTVGWMAPHLTHSGVHDHGFNNISTYGNLLRLIREKRIEAGNWEKRYYELALKCSGAVQARRWTRIQEGGGFIYSFNGPHSLFADTLRSLRSLALAHQLGHVLMEENDTRVSLLKRWAEHARITAVYNVYYGEERDAFDVRGRVAHESIFNLNDGRYRCPNSQQGYSPFTTWTRGLAWIMCGYAEELEFAETLEPNEVKEWGDLHQVRALMLKAARASCDYYIESSPADGIPYWDTGAPGLARLDDPLNQSADPFNLYEPVDSSAASIAAQGLLRLGHYLMQKGESTEGQRYWKAGLTIVDTLLSEPYMSLDPGHQGLILHSVYHRPNGWDYVPPGRQVPCGESSLWGDYHAREVALYLDRIINGGPYLTFWGVSD